MKIIDYDLVATISPDKDGDELFGGETIVFVATICYTTLNTPRRHHADPRLQHPDLVVCPNPFTKSSASFCYTRVDPSSSAGIRSRCQSSRRSSPAPDWRMTGSRDQRGIAGFYGRSLSLSRSHV